MALTLGPSPNTGRGAHKLKPACESLTLFGILRLHSEQHRSVTSPLPILIWECEGGVRASQSGNYIS